MRNSETPDVIGYTCIRKLRYLFQWPIVLQIIQRLSPKHILFPQEIEKTVIHPDDWIKAK